MRGFSLIELIAVLVLVGTLILMTPMALNALVPSRELEAETSRLGNMIQFLHQQAILDQAPHAIHYDTEHHRWAPQVPVEVVDELAEGENGQPLTTYVLDEDVPPEELDWHQLPDGMRLRFFEGSREKSGRYMVTFPAHGTVPVHSLVIESERVPSLDERERTRTVTVHFPGFVSYAVGRRIEDYKLTETEVGR